MGPREAPIQPPKESPGMFSQTLQSSDQVDYAILRFHKGSLYWSEIPDPVLHKLITQAAVSTGSICHVLTTCKKMGWAVKSVSITAGGAIPTDSHEMFVLERMQ